MSDPLRCVAVRRRLTLGAACAVLVCALTGPASADDIYEIDWRLQDAGLDLAYTDAFDAADRAGVRIVVDFDSGSQDEAAYRREADQAAELVWDHLEGRVLAVDVAPTYDVPWAEDGLPSALSFDRATLTERFGARPAGLDSADIETADEGGLAVVGAVVAGWLLSLLVVGTGTFLLARAHFRRPQTAVPPGYWHGPNGPSGSWPPAAVRPPEPSAPAHERPIGAPAQQPSDDPWRPLP